jgi:uncharacterized phage infection (PIP) family protein YhgE
LKYELEHFNKGIDKGLPTDERSVDNYLKDMEKHKSNLVQWLEDFKSKYGTFNEAQQTITDTESALNRYREKIGPIMAKVNINKAINARAADGSPLVIPCFCQKLIYIPN